MIAIAADEIEDINGTSDTSHLDKDHAKFASSGEQKAATSVARRRALADEEIALRSGRSHMRSRAKAHAVHARCAGCHYCALSDMRARAAADRDGSSGTS